MRHKLTIGSCDGRLVPTADFFLSVATWYLQASDERHAADGGH